MRFRQKCAQRQSRGNRLGNGDDVWNHTEALEGEHLAGTSESTLDLVEDKSGVVMIGQGAARKQEFFRTFENATFAKDGLEHDSAGVGIDRSMQRFEVVLLHKCHVIEHRLKAFTVLFLPRQRHRAECAPVVRTLQRHQLRLRVAPRPVSGETREFDRALHCLCATI